ncbi:MAG: hypothetical protein Fur002_09860 [Anaerolineales bacterium]
MSFNRKSLFVFFVSAMMLFSLSACGAAADAADAPADAPAESGDIVAAFTFTNTGSVEICELYLSPASQEDWGPDQLNGATIPVGEQFILKNIPAGLYDANIVGCNGAGEASGQLDIHN